MVVLVLPPPLYAHAGDGKAAVATGVALFQAAMGKGGADVPRGRSSSETADPPNAAGPRAPDGGYGWVIVFASFMANTIVDGIAYSFGILLPEFTNYYKGTVQTAAWVGSLLTGTYMLVGPVASGLINKFGARFVCILGSILGTIAFVSSAWAPSLQVLMLTYGVLGGIGFGFIYLPACIYVSYYFDKKRALATGIAVAGSGFGTFIFAPLTVALIEAFCWQGTLWMMAGIIANCGVCGALLWPLRQKSSTVIVQEESVPALTKIPEETSLTESVPEEMALLEKPKVSVQTNKANKRYSQHTRDAGTRLLKKFQSVDESLPLSNEKISSRQRSTSQQVVNSSVPGRAFSLHSLYGAASSLEVVDKPLSKQDIFYPGSVHKIPEVVRAQSIASVEEEATKPRSDEMEEMSDHLIIRSERSKKLCGCLPPSVSEVLSSMVDFQLLKHPTMLILCIANIVGMLGFYVPFVFMSSYSESMGNSKESSSLLLSVIGITNTLGRVLFGWVSDQHWVAALTINNWALLICGVLTCLCMFFNSYALLMTYCVFFGLIIAPYVSLSAVVLVEEIGLEHLTSAFGLLTLARGISSMVGSPVGGAIFDMTGSYGISFFFAGALIFISGLISYLIPLMRHLRNRKKLVRSNAVHPVA